MERRQLILLAYCAAILVSSVGCLTMVTALNEQSWEQSKASSPTVELSLGKISEQTERLDGDFLPYEIYLKRQSEREM